MKIVDRKTFLSLQNGTVYMKYQDCITGDMGIKEEAAGDNDWWYVQLNDFNGWKNTGDFYDKCQQMKAGISLPNEFDTISRDGFFDEDQLFMIFETEDVQKLIERLQRTLL